jgi:hypothetical protein
MPTTRTLQQNPAHRPAFPPFTTWAAKAVRPPQPDQKFSACCLRRKPRLKFGQISGVFLHGRPYYILGPPESSGYPTSVYCRIQTFRHILNECWKKVFPPARLLHEENQIQDAPSADLIYSTANVPANGPSTILSNPYGTLGVDQSIPVQAPYSDYKFRNSGFGYQWCPFGSAVRVPETEIDPAVHGSGAPAYQAKRGFCSSGCFSRPQLVV